MMVIASCYPGFRPAAVAALLLAMLLTGCAGSSVTPNYYTLAVENTAVKPVETGAVSLGIWPVELPDLLDRAGIVSWQPQLRVDISSTSNWAEALDENITRVISADIGRRMPAAYLWSYPWDSRQRPDYQLRIRLQSLAGALAGPVVLEGHWVLRGGPDNRLLERGQVRLRQTVEGDGYDGYVAAINRLLNRFSGELTARIAPLLR